MCRWMLCADGSLNVLNGVQMNVRMDVLKDGLVNGLVNGLSNSAIPNVRSQVCGLKCVVSSVWI